MSSSEGLGISRNRNEPVRPDDLPMLYSRAITIARSIPRDPAHLILGLGGGAIPTISAAFFPMQRSIPSSSILA